MFTPSAVLIAVVFLVLALALRQGVCHIAKLRRGPALANQSDDAWGLFDDIQDQITREPAGENSTRSFLATFDEKLSDSVVAAALQLLEDAGWDITPSAPGCLLLK